MKYPRELRVVLLLRNLGASLDGVHIGRNLGWGVEICGVIWSHSLALRSELLSFSNTIISLGHSIIFHPSPQIFINRLNYIEEMCDVLLALIFYPKVIHYQ